jgi:hypothetical protein
MLKYECSDCGMGVKGLTCGKCGAELCDKTIKNAQGKDIEVSECPKGCGKIKSPMCCGHDMRAQA